MPFPNEHSARQSSPDQYVRFNRQNDKFGAGIHAIFGVLRGGGTELQSIRFNKNRFTPVEARRWLKSHDFKTGLEVATEKSRVLTNEYLKTFLAISRKMLPSWILSQLHKLSMPKSGGLARWRNRTSKSFYQTGSEDPSGLPFDEIFKDGFENHLDDPGVVILCKIDHTVAEKLAIKDGLPPASLHCTLVYLGRMSMAEDNLHVVRQVLSEVLAFQDPLPGKINSVGRFGASETSDMKDVLFAGLDVPGLSKLRSNLTDALDFAGVPFASSHDFTPHITLSYVTPLTQQEVPMPDFGVEMKAVHLVAGESEEEFKLAAAHEDDDELYSKRKVTLMDRRNVSRGTSVEKFYEVAILKVDHAQQIVTGVVMEPDTEDSQGDVISEEEIAKTMHDFAMNSRRIGLSHRRRIEAAVVEIYQAPVNFSFEGQRVKKGSWIMSVQIFDADIWKDVEAGLLRSFSVGGFATREPEAA